MAERRYRSRARRWLGWSSSRIETGFKPMASGDKPSWLEASALGIPTIADPYVYSEIEDGVTGFHAQRPEEMAIVLRQLLADRELRDRVGEAARQHVHSERSSDAAAAQWLEVCSAVAGGYESMSQLMRREHR